MCHPHGVSRSHGIVALIRALLFSCLVTGAGVASGVAQPASSNLSLATLEELMDIEVTSAARKSQRAEDVAAAIFVITRDDIRRSGHTTLPEVLRLAPGVQVAQISASRWAISMRGFNGLYANKLLVLVDGRSVYTRTFSGVLWDMQHLMLSDVERIEVIRGPGGTSWGANAVNGVINIITRSAEDTAGLAIDVSRGSFARELGGIRYGGTLGRTPYRVYSQWSGFADSAPVGSVPFSDRWHSLTSGFRTDWARGSDAVVTQGHVTAQNTRPGQVERSSLRPGDPVSVDGIGTGTEASVLSRWTRTQTDGTILQVQGYHTTTRRNEPILRMTEHSTDLDAQYETRLGARHGLVMGGGYRHVDIASDGSVTMELGSARIDTLSAFVQDEIAFGRAVAVTLGSKVEHDTFGGWGLLPSARVMWDAASGQRVWAAVSRARRTPSLADRDLRVIVDMDTSGALPVILSAVGNAAFSSEHLMQTEAGHRTRLGPSAALDTTVFTGSYRDLRTYEPQAPLIDGSHGMPLVLVNVAPANLASARASGIEFAAQWTPVGTWRLDGSYSYLRLTGRPDPGSQDMSIDSLAGLDPAHQWQLRSDVRPLSPLRLTASLGRTAELHHLGVPAYTRLDGRAELRLSQRMTTAVVGQNLSRAQHTEYPSDGLFLSSSMPRSVRIDLRWQF